MLSNLNNHDTKLKYYELILYRPDLEGLPEYALPEGYSFCFYQSEQDREEWLAIETSAGEFLTLSEGREAWEEYYGDGQPAGHLSKAARGKELPTVGEELSRRMLFVVAPSGEKVATATAFFEPEDTSGAGWMHWVAVRRDHQGRGLARPLIAKVLSVLRELGYQDVKIPTQTNTWLAVKLYLDFGFSPLPENAESSRQGYRIVRTLTRHPALQEFPPLPWESLFDPVVTDIEYQLMERFPDLDGYKVWWKDGRNEIWFVLRGETEARSVNYRVDEKGKVEILLPERSYFLISAFEQGFSKEFANEVKNRLPGVLNSFAFVASDFFLQPARTDFYYYVFLEEFEKVGISFAESRVVDGRMTPEEAQAWVRSAEVVWLAGGDTRLEMENLRNYGLEVPLKERKGITIGMSAGAMNMAEHVITGQCCYEGLGMVDFNVIPHLDWVDERQKEVAAKLAEVALVYGIPDGSFILAENGEKKFFGEYVLFSKGGEEV